MKRTQFSCHARFCVRVFCRLWNILSMCTITDVHNNCDGSDVFWITTARCPTPTTTHAAPNLGGQHCNVRDTSSGFINTYIQSVCTRGGLYCKCGCVSAINEPRCVRKKKDGSCKVQVFHLSMKFSHPVSVSLRDSSYLIIFSYQPGKLAQAP